MHGKAFQLTALLCVLVFAGCPKPPVICNLMEAYNPATGQRRSLGESPFKMWNPVHLAAGDGHVYALSSTGALRVFDLDKAAWSTLPSPDQDGWGRPMGLAKGLLVVFGETRVHRLDLEEKRWTIAAAMPDRRRDFALVRRGDDFTIIAGDSANGPLSSCYDYDTGADRFQPIADLPEVRTDFAAGLLEGTLMVAGGHDRHGAMKLHRDSTLAYDPKTNAWTRVGPFEHPFGWDNFCFAVVGGRFTVFLHELRGGTTTVLTWLPDRKRWDETDTSALLRRKRPGVAVVGDEVLFYGGLTYDYRAEEVPGQDEKRAVFITE